MGIQKGHNSAQPLGLHWQNLDTPALSLDIPETGPDAGMEKASPYRTVQGQEQSRQWKHDFYSLPFRSLGRAPDKPKPKLPAQFPVVPKGL